MGTTSEEQFVQSCLSWIQSSFSDWEIRYALYLRDLVPADLERAIGKMMETLHTGDVKEVCDMISNEENLIIKAKLKVLVIDVLTAARSYLGAS